MEIHKGTKKIEIPIQEKKPIINIITDTRKIIITKNKKKVNNTSKTYYSYQLNIPKKFLMLIQDNYEYGKGKSNYLMHLIEIHKQHYAIKLAPHGVDCLLSLPNIYGGIGKKEKPNIQFTLPKKDMAYIQAFDKYQDAINKFNQEQDKKIKARLYAELYLYQKFNIEYMHFEYELHINLKANIDDEFVNYIKNDESNPGGIPSWLETLKIDWSDPAVQKLLGISASIKDYDLHKYAGDTPVLNIDEINANFNEIKK